MNIFQQYFRYLKDNPEGYWFKRKLYGWGWTPATWQGWVTLVAFLAVFFWIFVPFISNPEPTDSAVFWFLIKVGTWVVSLL